MIVSMALLAGADAFFKLATLVAPVGQVMTLVSFGGTALFIALAALRRVRLWSRDALHPMVLLRNGFEIIGAIGMVVGIKHTPLPTFAAIIQTGPLIVVLGAALFLGEHVGWRRWVAVGVGIVGMLIVIRPFGTGFSGWELFAVMGIAALSGRDLVTRLSPPHIPALAISTWGFGVTVIPGAILWAFATAPSRLDAVALWPILGAVVVTATGYLAITTAMRMAPASVVSPFRYTRLVFTTGLGMLIFGDRPDFWTLAGASLILAAGLYSFLRERRLAKETLAQTQAGLAR